MRAESLGSAAWIWNLLHQPALLEGSSHFKLLVVYPLAGLMVGNVGWMFGASVPTKPAGYGLTLVGVYMVWLAALLLLYPLCSWFAALKRRRHDRWLSYL